MTTAKSEEVNPQGEEQYQIIVKSLSTIFEIAIANVDDICAFKASNGEIKK